MTSPAWTIRLPSSSRPLHKALYHHLRMLILGGVLAPGRRLPSSRTIAQDLGCSRNTVNAAFEQLLADGWVTARRGSGFYVAELAALARIGPLAFASLAEPEPQRPFLPGAAALDLFPLKEWMRLQAARWRQLPPNALLEGDIAGWPDLRKSVAAHLAASRGLACSPDQVFIVSSTNAALHLIARTLLNAGDVVLAEDPGYHGARRVFEAAGCRVASMPVDESGADLASGLRAAPHARAAYVTPATQFPTGVVMTDERREIAVRAAVEADLWIIEDDYDADLAVEPAPPSPLAARGAADRIIFVGSFNKLLFPALRIAYFVVPPGLAEQFRRMRAYSEGPVSSPQQMILTDFMEQGYFAAHLRRFKSAVNERRAAMLDVLDGALPQGCRLVSKGRDPNIRIEFPEGAKDGAAAKYGLEAGLDLVPLSIFYSSAPPMQGLMLGFSAFTVSEIRAAAPALIATIARALDDG